MPSVIELHDSVVTRFDERDGSIVIRLSPAWLHRAPSKPGIEAGEVFTLDLDIILSSATISVPFTEIPTELQGGAVTVGNERFDNCIPFPLDATCNINVELIDYYGRDVRVIAKSVSLVAATEERYAENFPGTEA
ncbi:MAG: hypothetical protein ABJ360_10635 [Roseobacter sp.]|uniref:hypothetical protein n=1 Tax=Rhodopirellula bahusiensis TaxID=2014065 RepID=UPI0032668EB9